MTDYPPRKTEAELTKAELNARLKWCRTWIPNFAHAEQHKVSRIARRSAKASKVGKGKPHGKG